MSEVKPVPLVDQPAVQARRWWILVILCLSLIIVFVGNSSLNVAIPSLSRDLDATTSQLQWIIAAYALVFAGLLFTAGALGDRFGRKKVLQLGLALFLLSALAASASTATWQLIASRAVMGAAAALIMPSTLSILVNVFRPEERTKAIAIWAAAAGVAGIIGPIASGFLLGHFWYGSVFLINVPIVVIALVAGYFIVPESMNSDKDPLDPVGAILSIITIVTFVYGLIQAPDQGWGSPATLAAFGVGARRAAVRAVGAAGPRADGRRALLPDPGVQRGRRRHDRRVPDALRDDVPRHPVLPARARLHAAVGRAAPPADGADPDHRVAADAAAQRPHRCPPHGGPRPRSDHPRHAAVPGPGTAHARTRTSSPASSRWWSGWA